MLADANWPCPPYEIVSLTGLESASLSNLYSKQLIGNCLLNVCQKNIGIICTFASVFYFYKKINLSYIL